MKWASPYESAVRCTNGPEPGARALLAWGLETYSSAYSLGIYNCRTVAGSSTTSIHGEGRAVDLGLPMIGGRGTPLGHSIVRRLGENGVRLGIQAIVYDRQVWSARSPSGRRYDGVHPHYDHLHIEMTRDAARRLTLATFRHVLGGVEEQEGDIMYLVRRGQGNNVADGDPYVKYWQTRWRQMGYDIGTFGPNKDGVDGKYGPTGERVVNEICKAAGLPEDGSVGFNVNAALHFERRWALEHAGGGGGTSGLTKTQADGLYAARSHGHPHDHPVPAGKTGRAG